MKVEPREITVRDVCEGYLNRAEDGVVGYQGRLNIRPRYQREFVYKDHQRNAVIDTVRKGFPLNVMYWALNPDGTFEVLDGQQRTLSLCEFVDGNFSIELPGNVVKYFHNMEEDEKEQILGYKLLVYFCEGTESEKLDWFKIINIAGEKLTDQELRNAVYTGTWLTDAKRYFSKPGGPAYAIANRFMEKSPIRQEYLETALDWISTGHIEDYMAEHQHKSNAIGLWTHFQSVISWVDALFGKHTRRELKSVPWGDLYARFHEKDHSATALEEHVAHLMQDDDVTRKAGIYHYVFTGEERHLSIRAFTPSQKRAAYERQGGVCPACVKAKAPKTTYTLEEMEADHVTPWCEGGKTAPENCQTLCKLHNRQKSDN